MRDLELPPFLSGTACTLPLLAVKVTGWVVEPTMVSLLNVISPVGIIWWIMPVEASKNSK